MQKSKMKKQNGKPTKRCTYNLWFVICGLHFFAKQKNGFGLIEIIVSTAVVSIALLSFSQIGVLSLKLLRNAKENLEAILLAQESLEAVRSVRDESWSNIMALVNGTSYYPVVQNSKWVLSPISPGLVNNKYTRYVVFGPVTRDTQDRIAPTGTLDAGTRSVTSRVLWGRGEEVAVSYTGGTTDADLANFPSNNSGNGDPTQEFRTPTGNSIVISSVDLLLKRVGTPSDIFLEIRGGTQVGSLLATSLAIDADTIPATSLTWIKFTFLTPAALAPSTQYFLRLRSVPSSNDAFSGSAGTINWGYLQTALSPYPDGNAWRYVGRLSNPNDIGQVLTQYDFSFRVYKENTSGKQVEVVTYFTNFQGSLVYPKEQKIVSFENATTDANLAGFPSSNSGDGDPVQSFTNVASSTKATKVELRVKKATAAPSDIYVELRSSPTGGVLGTSQIINSSTASSSMAWTEFRFPAYVTLATSTKYYIRLRSIPTSTDTGSGSLGTIHWGYLQTASSPYSGGEARRYVGRLSNPGDSGQILDQYDFGFRVYALK